MLCIGSGLATDAHAAGAKNRSAPPPPASEPVPASMPAAGKKAAPVSADEAIEALLKRARECYDGLDYDQVIPFASAVLARSDPTPDQRLDAYLLQGSALAIVGDSIEAEKSFRPLLRGRPDFDLPLQTPPKIVAIFRKVQAEERTINDQLKALQREHIRGGLTLTGAHPAPATGGYPIAFNYRLRDPGNAVEEMRIHYRRQGEVSYSSLALKHDAEGAWRGAIPGGWTSSDKPYTLEFFVVTADREGPLLAVGSDRQPRQVPVAAGTVEQTKPPPLALWTFWVAAGLSATTLAAASGSAVATLIAQQDYRDYVAQGLQRPIDGAILNQKASVGQALATATNVLWIASAVGVIGTGVMTPFVNWSGHTVE